MQATAIFGNGLTGRASRKLCSASNQRCAVCWKITNKDLSDRLHICSNAACNYTEDRDVNSAQVCLAWARGLERSSKTADESSSTGNPKVKYCGGFQQLAQIKRLKLMAQQSSHE